LNLSTATATHWKNGTMPKGDVLLNIANLFDCSVDYLLGRADEPNSNSITTGSNQGNNNDSSVKIHDYAVDGVSREMLESNIKFSELQKVLDTLGFECRIKGDHFIYTKDGITEIINVQPKGNTAKAYQVKQLRELIIKYKLGGIE
jgi:predicted RNA binding protein YcfA (HicA-like mRNA interferase family)